MSFIYRFFLLLCMSFIFNDSLFHHQPNICLLSCQPTGPSYIMNYIQCYLIIYLLVLQCSLSISFFFGFLITILINQVYEWGLNIKELNCIGANLWKRNYSLIRFNLALNSPFMVIPPSARWMDTPRPLFQKSWLKRPHCKVICDETQLCIINLEPVKLF